MPRTSTATLTERYISATVHSLPPETQDDVRAELEASIADAVEARREQGEGSQSAERAVIVGLGDPGVLAAGYADRPLQLIGPKYYLTWWRLLKVLLWIVPTFAGVGVAIGKVFEFATFGETAGAVATTVVLSIVHVGFWTTLVFAILERTATGLRSTWNPDRLPDPTDPGPGRADLIATAVFLVAAAGAILWDALRGFVRDDGVPVPILDPALWPLGMAVLFALMLGELVLAIVVYRARRWTIGAAVVNTLLAVAFVAVALYLLLSDQLVNPGFLEYLATAHAAELAEVDARAAEQGGIMNVLSVILGVVIVGAGLWDAIDGWIKALRARRS
ncbi:permease prefix domain 1-containing protein [Microbacterium sp. 1.5R]|uniref:permease prefix domain 1-containing protein n=1 Tax=Microbacterium sp. 1.5R TaxID=1916917 RepID=UPI0011A62FDE|nr:permease prefix domain 1-containing protein [Microbacterium sp. 1.5R]